MQIKQLTNEEFNKFKETFPTKSIYQTVEYGFTMNHQNFDSLLLGLVDENNNVLGASLILIQKITKLKYAYAPRGFLIDYNDLNLLTTFTAEIKKYLAKINVVAIKISPLIVKNVYDKKYNIDNQNQYYDNIFNNLIKLGYKHLGYNNYFEALKPRFEAVIDLNKPYYLLFKNIRKEFRTKIRSADEKGMKIYKGNYDNLELLYLQTKKKYPRDLEYFKDCYNFFGKSSNIDFYYSKLDTEKYLKYCNNKYQVGENYCTSLNEQLLSPNNENIINQKLIADAQLNKYKNELILATKYLRDFPEGIVTSSVLVVKEHDEVYLFIDGFDPKYKILNSKHLLIWKLCEKYANEGFKKFNLGGISNPKLEDNLYSGLNDFKLGFNAMSYEYIGDLELVCNNTLYFMFKNSPIKAILKK